MSFKEIQHIETFRLYRIPVLEKPLMKITAFGGYVQASVPLKSNKIKKRRNK
jgi:hypothetical protein